MVQLSFPPVRRKKIKPKTLRSLEEPFKSSHEARKVLLKLTSEDDLEDIKFSLSHLMKEKPVEVYAIVVELLRAPRKRALPQVITEGVEEMARLAARKSLPNPLELGGWHDKMNIGSLDYSQLARYHFRCKHRPADIFWTGSFLKSAGTKWVWCNTRCGVCPPAPESFEVRDEVLGITEYPPKWWVEYWKKVLASVKEFPCGGAFEDGSIRNDTLQTLARMCPTCYEAAAKELPLFEGQLLSVVAKVIDGVRVFVDRCLPRD